MLTVLRILAVVIMAVLTYGGFLIPIVAAFMLWDVQRTLAWVSVGSVILGITPFLGWPMGVGFIAYAQTESTAVAVTSGAITLLVVGGLLLGSGVLLDREPEVDEPVSGFGVPAQAGPLPSAQVSDRFCRQCGTEIVLGARFCGGCGKKLVEF